MTRIPALTLALALAVLVPLVYSQQASAAEGDAEVWLPSLITETPQEGFALAVTLARKGVGTTQTDSEVLKKLRPAYSHDPDSLIAASQVVAIHFQTVAAANNYWRSE